jgi:hypothetical protein
LFNLAIHDATAGTTERFLNLSPDPANARFVSRVLEQQSNLIGIDGTPASTRPGKHDDLGPGDDPWDPAENFSTIAALSEDQEPLHTQDLCTCAKAYADSLFSPGLRSVTSRRDIRKTDWLSVLMIRLGLCTCSTIA